MRGRQTVASPVAIRVLAHSIGKAAWLLWDDLDPQLKWMAASMICDEADRFVGKTPPAQVENDTKAEENAWNAMIISLACNMFPHHPHREAWRETAIRWAVTSFVTSKDVVRTDIVDGRPLKDWLTGPNIHDDYTLENHNRVHPDYMSTIRINLSQKLDYDWAGQPEPAALRLNAERIYANLKKLAFPDGGWVYPNGEDWQLHHPPEMLDLNAMMAVLFNDPQAARLLRICVHTTEQMMAQRENGGIHEPEEILVATTHAIPAELHADAYLLMRELGEGPPPVEADQLWKDLAGKYVFAAGKFAVLRTPRSIATFSWGRVVMGMAMPLRKDLLLTPNERSLIGIVQMPGAKRDTPRARKIVLGQDPGELTVTGILDRGAGAVEQRFAFVALNDGTTVYADVLNAAGFAKPATIDLGVLGVLNEPRWVYHDGQRTLRYEGGEKIFHAADAEKGESLDFSSPWCNLDGLGIVCLKTAGHQVYTPKPSMTRGRLEQMFCLNHVTSPAATSAADAPFASTVLVLYPDQPWQVTRTMTTRCRCEGDDPFRFAVILHDGRRIVINLQNSTVVISGG